MPPRPKSAALLSVNADRDCHLFCFPSGAPLEGAALLLLHAMVAHRRLRKAGEDWVVFSGEGGHTRGLDAWLAVTDNVPPPVRQLFLERLAGVTLFGAWEADKTIRPSKDGSLKPVLRLSDEGGELLVGPRDRLAFDPLACGLPVRVCVLVPGVR